jgi:hypothetical protein
MFGFVGIAATGGHEHQELTSVDAASATATTTVSDSSGTLASTASTASSYARAETVCVLPGATGCAVSAQLVKAQSNSAANATAASANDSGTSFVGASVLGTATTVETPRNTVIELPGIGFVILNEQFCDDGAPLPSCAGGAEPGHAGLTVRAIHVVVTVPANPAGVAAGGEVIVAEAHSDAAYR